jgi:molybdenum cofactor cytidylyltransferase
MGRAKATLPLGATDTFLTRIVRTFVGAGVDDIVIVVGHEAEAIAQSFAASELPPGVAARLVVNRHYDRGQLSSLQSAVAVVDRPGVSALLMTLVDVPLVSTETVRAVIECYRRTSAVIVRPTDVARGRHGHPVLIDRSLFEAVRAADPAAGAKGIVRAHATRAGDLPIEDEGAFIDVDTAQDYERLVGDLKRGARIGWTPDSKR